MQAPTTHLRIVRILVTASSAGQDVEMDHSYVMGGDAKWYSHSREQSGSFLSNYTCKNHVIQQLHPWVFIPKEVKI